MKTDPTLKAIKLLWLHPNRQLAFDARLTHPARCLQLGISIGIVGAFVQFNNNSGNGFTLSDKLADIGAWAFGWIERLEQNGADISPLIIAERDRQETLFRAGKLSFNCNSPVADDVRKFGVLLEEGGEVAEAVELLEDSENQIRREQLKTELIQVAAVCIAWMTTPSRKGAKS